MSFNKKIYYIANARMPTEKAHGIQLAKMCEAFVEQGADIELIVPNRKTAAQTIQDFYGLRTPVSVKKLPVIDWYGANRIGFFIGSASFALGYFFYLLGKRLRGESCIVYMTDIDQFSFFLIPFAGIPYFCEIHDAKKKNLRFSLLFRRARGIITINSIIKRELCAIFGIAREKIIIHPNGIDMTMYASAPSQESARRSLDLPLDKKIILYAGKFYSWKGLDILFDAAVDLDDDMLIVFVGGTEEDLKKATGKTFIPKQVKCAGHQDFKKIPQWLAAADVLLVLGTKQNDYSYLHTSPMKCFEYMASLRPIVGSATPANREIITEKEALLYEPDNAKDLGEKIMYALSHREEMSERAQGAYTRVQTFAWDARAERILGFMQLHKLPI